MVKKKNASSSDSADRGASLSANRGAESAGQSGASYVAKRAAMASALDLGANAGITTTCSKLITKNTDKMSRPEQYPSWAASMLTLLSVTCVQGWAIATGNTTPASVFDPKAGTVAEVTDEDAETHMREVYEPNNRWLYMLLITYMKGPKMRAIVKQAMPNDGFSLWRTLKSRMERGGAVRKRTLLQQFWRAAMKPAQTIVEWTDALGEMRVSLADQFDVDISDADICGQALQGIKALYRPVRDTMNAEADKPGVTWEGFVVKLHRACDVIDMDADADAEADLHVYAATTEGKKSHKERIRELEAEIAKLRRENASAEETATDTEETTDVAEEPSDSKPAHAGLAFTF